MAVTSIVSSAPKLKYQGLEEYQKSLAASNAANPSTQATGYFQSIASGKTSPALSASLAANREAIARAAGNLRAQTAQTLAQGGSLGQGQAIRGTQETERSILGTMADNRSKELQALGEAQGNANQVLLSQANADRSSQLAGLQAGLGSDSAAVKQASLRGLSNYLNSQGIQMADAESADALDAFMAKKAEEDPLYQAERLKAQQTLATEQVNALRNGGGSFGSQVFQIAKMGRTGDASSTFTSQIGGAGQNDVNVFNNAFLPRIQSGQDMSAKIDEYINLRNSGMSAGDAALRLFDPGALSKKLNSNPIMRLQHGYQAVR